jgi:hypothetical protein
MAHSVDWGIALKMTGSGYFLALARRLCSFVCWFGQRSQPLAAMGLLVLTHPVVSKSWRKSGGGNAHSGKEA